MDKKFIKIKNITKKFNNLKIVDNININIKKGEFFVLLGPSGCGKTTLMKIIAGFEEQTSGNIIIDNININNLTPNKRPTNMVFQSYAIFPHMNIFKNIAYGLKLRNLEKNEIKEKVNKILETVKLTEHKNKLPDQLSGGQLQRTALARALILKPKVLLLDEPLSALDAQLREKMQDELVYLQKKTGITFLMVTHDQEEALSMADTIGVMKEGKMIQIGAPDEIYEKPSNTFVASFVGRSNFLVSKIKNIKGNNIFLDIGNDIIIKAKNTNTLKKLKINTKVKAVIRPEKINILEKNNSSKNYDNVLQGKIKRINYYGVDMYYTIAINNTNINFLAILMNRDKYTKNNYKVDSNIKIAWSTKNTLIFLD